MRTRPQRQYLTEILMERIAWQMMQTMPTKDIARLNQKSVATILRIRRLKEFHFVFERVKGTAFAHIAQRGQSAVDRAIQIFKDSAPDIAQRIVDLATRADVSLPVQLAAGVQALNKAGVQTQPATAVVNPFLDRAVIELDQETTRQIEQHPANAGT